MSRLQPFFGPSTDEKNLVVDQREIDDQTSNPPQGDRTYLIDPLLSRELVHRGEALFAQEPSTRHGQTRYQQALSTSMRGECYRLVPCEPSRDSILVSVRIRGQVVQGHFRREPLPTRMEVEAFVHALSPEEQNDLRLRYRALNLEELVNFMPHRSRPDRIIDNSALYVSGVDALDAMSRDQIWALCSVFEDVAKSHLEGGAPDPAKIQMIRDLKTVLPDRNYGEIYGMLKELARTHTMRDEIMGIDRQAEGGSKPYDPKPVCPPNWGLPNELIPHLKSRKTWASYLSMGVVDPKTRKTIMSSAWSRARINEEAARLGVKQFLKFDDGQGQLPPSWHELSAAVAKVEADYNRELESWSQRQTGEAQWAALGKIVSQLTEFDENENLSESLWDSPDVRPKPGLAEEAPALMNPEEQYFKDSLTSGATPEDSTLWMGDTGAFAPSLPYSVRKDPSGDLILGGHPLAGEIEDFMDELRKDKRHPVSIGVQSDPSEICRLTLPSNLEVHQVIVAGRMCDVAFLWPEMELESDSDSAKLDYGVRLNGRTVVEVYPGSASRAYDLVPHTWFNKEKGFVAGVKRVPRDRLFVGDLILKAKLDGEDLCVTALRKGVKTVTVRLKKDWNRGRYLKPTPNSGVPVILDMSTATPANPKARHKAKSFSVMGRIFHPNPGPAYTHKLKSWNPIEQQWTIINKKDPLLRYYADGDEIPAKLDFRTWAEYLAYRLPVLLTPTVYLSHEEDSWGNPVRHPRINWVEVREVFPKLCDWVMEASQRFNDGEEGLTDFFVKVGEELQPVWTRDPVTSEMVLTKQLRPVYKDLLDDASDELSAYQSRMLRTLAIGNFPIVKELVGELNNILRTAVYDPAVLTERVWGPNSDQSLYGYYFASGGRFWNVVRLLQGRDNVIVLPPEADQDMELLWKAVGYLRNRSDRVADRHILERQIAQVFFRFDPQAENRWTGSPRYSLNVSATTFSRGLLGDKKAQVLNAIYPVQVPGLSNLFVPSKEAFEGAKSWDAALRRHTFTEVKKDLWGPGSQHRAFRLASRWGRQDFTGRDKVAETVKAFIEELFPDPVCKAIGIDISRYNADARELGVSIEMMVKEMVASAGKARADAVRAVQVKRKLALSTFPSAALQMLNATDHLDALRAFGIQRMKRLLTTVPDKIGPLTEEIGKNLVSLAKQL